MLVTFLGIVKSILKKSVGVFRWQFHLCVARQYHPSDNMAKKNRCSFAYRPLSLATRGPWLLRPSEDSPDRKTQKA